MSKTRWMMERVMGPFRVYSRMGRGEIIVRVENDGDTTKYMEWGYPKIFGLGLAMDQAVLETRPEHITE
jgi:hypothetical protein